MSNLECRVLLAEDMPDNQRLVSFYLKQAGAEVFFADNGQIALDIALEASNHGFPFDVILMDIQMPVLNGNEATKKLRESGYTGAIIAITAHTSSHDRQTCLDAGCDDYTTKPVNPNRLIDLVAHYASKRKRKELTEDTVIV
ncbi:response regulator [Gimesia aquarii]|nr:response regulator [Gimesia aquarii]